MCAGQRGAGHEGQAWAWGQPGLALNAAGNGQNPHQDRDGTGSRTLAHKEMSYGLGEGPGPPPAGSSGAAPAMEEEQGWKGIAVEHLWQGVRGVS